MEKKRNNAKGKENAYSNTNLSHLFSREQIWNMNAPFHTKNQKLIL